MAKDVKQQALDYHRHPPAGKIEVVPTKALTTQGDLALAYSPGVAAACEAIVEDPTEAGRVTARSNLVGVITNGSAVLGLGNIGALAAKPVMEGKGVLFKKFAGIDVFDIEVDQSDPERFVETVAALEPTFGGINLEDIKAPECFYIERALRDRMTIPVFHDDQHGTAIITAAAMINALQVIGRDIADIRLVTSGAGAAGVACLDLLVELGMRRENILVTDRQGVVYEGREDYGDDPKGAYAQDTKHRSLADAIAGADAFLGVSAAGVLKREMVKTMSERPIILALANPEPEILPEEAKAANPDCIIATGRSDYPNQVNNVLCFPYIFRGALDVGATGITEAMKVAAVHAIAALARKEASDVSTSAYGGEAPTFGPEYLIPQPFDPRLPVYVAPAVAQAATDSGVATRPIDDMDAYRESLSQFVFRTGLIMKPMFDAAKAEPKRVVFAEGEEERVLRAVQVIVDDGLAKPILIGRPEVIESRIERYGLRIQADRDFEVTNPESDPRYRDYWQDYHRLMERRGISPDTAKGVIRTRTAAIASMMVRRGDADALICGTVGRFERKLAHVTDILGLRQGVASPSALSAIATGERTVFVCDTYVNPLPTPQDLCESTLMAAERVRAFNMKPKVALLSHSSFGTHDDAAAAKMREALRLIRDRAPDLEVDGEMHADAALDEAVRRRIFPNSRLTGTANLLVMPALSAANIAFNMGRVLSGGVTIGPMLMGVNAPAHVLTPSCTVRRIVNMAAVSVVDAQRNAIS